MKDILSIQIHVRARGEIIILTGNEMYDVPIEAVLKTFLYYNGGHLRYGHGIDSCVTVWILPLRFVVMPILNIPVVYRASLILKRLSFLQFIYSKSGNNQWQLWIYFIFKFFCAPLSTCSYELSPLQGSSVSIQNLNVEICRKYLLCRYRVTWWKSK